MEKFAEIVFLGIEENNEYSKLIETVVDKCFEVENLQKSKLYISISLTTPEQIRKLNKEYRNVDSETDVLSFPVFEKSELEEIKTSDMKFEDTLRRHHYLSCKG